MKFLQCECSVLSGCFYEIINDIDSQEAALRKYEQMHKTARWVLTDVRYINEVHNLEVAAKENILRKLQQVASERAFLVSLLQSYCG